MAVSALSNPKLALLIGIEYLGTPNELLGCQRDVDNMYNLLTGTLGFAPGNITILTESSGRPPTQAAILSALGELVTRSRTMNATQSVIYYSGHGSQLPDQVQNGSDERDGMDEVLVPLDYKNGNIRDDVLLGYLNQFPFHCVCLGIWDSCNSGTVADLPYRFRYDPQTDTCIPVKNNQMKMVNNVVSISGSRDDQTSSVVYTGGEWNSALTTAVIHILGSTREQITFHQLQKRLTDYMIAQQLHQRPVVCCSWQAQPGALILTERPFIRKDTINKETELAQAYEWAFIF